MSRPYVCVDCGAYGVQRGGGKVQVVRVGCGDLVAYAEQVPGLSPSFLATGMPLSVLALMQVQDGAEHWAATLLEGSRRTCRGLSA